MSEQEIPETPAPLPSPNSSIDDVIVRRSWIVRHIDAYRQMSPWTFCWKITVEGLVVSLGAAILLNISGAPPREIKLSLGAFAVVAIIVAPILETLLFQAFPIFIATCLKFGFWSRVVSSGIATFIASGLLFGLYLGFTYAHFRQHSRWRAFWVTATSHALHNTVAVLLMMLAR